MILWESRTPLKFFLDTFIILCRLRRRISQIFVFCLHRPITRIRSNLFSTIGTSAKCFGKNASSIIRFFGAHKCRLSLLVASTTIQSFFLTVLPSGIVYHMHTITLRELLRFGHHLSCFVLSETCEMFLCII